CNALAEGDSSLADAQGLVRGYPYTSARHIAKGKARLALRDGPALLRFQSLLQRARRVHCIVGGRAGAAQLERYGNGDRQEQDRESSLACETPRRNSREGPFEVNAGQDSAATLQRNAELHIEEEFAVETREQIDLQKSFDGKAVRAGPDIDAAADLE